MRRALVLSGGGSKGAYQVGAIKALTEAGRSWDSAHGISVGALNASWISMYPPDEQAASIAGLEGVWAQVRTSRDIYRPWLPLGLNYIASMWKGSLNTGAPLRKLVERFWDVERSRASGVRLTVGCVSLTTTRYQSFDQKNPRIKDYILASSHLPVIFEPLEIDGELWIDGGIRHQVPFIEALRTFPDEIDVVLTQPIVNYDSVRASNDSLRSAPSVSIRGAGIFSDQVYFEDCSDVVRVALGKSSSWRGVKVNLHIPSRIPNSDSMDFDGDKIQSVIAMGYQETRMRLLDADVRTHAALHAVGDVIEDPGV